MIERKKEKGKYLYLYEGEWKDVNALYALDICKINHNALRNRLFKYFNTKSFKDKGFMEDLSICIQTTFTSNKDFEKVENYSAFEIKRAWKNGSRAYFLHYKNELDQLVYNDWFSIDELSEEFNLKSKTIRSRLAKSKKGEAGYESFYELLTFAYEHNKVPKKDRKIKESTYSKNMKLWKVGSEWKNSLIMQSR